ncbi:MAG: molybdenum cofactor biosynthesis protein [Actinomycetota bacterium]
MRVRVRLFGGLVDRTGLKEETVTLGDAPTAGDLLDALAEHHPEVARLAAVLQVAVNLEVVPSGHPVRRGDEVALLPPVAGGQTRIVAGLRERPSVEEALEAVGSPEAGGTVVFLGTVRAEGGRVERLEYSAYEAMAERVLREIVEEAAGKWPLEGVAVFHAVGRVDVLERTVVVACSAPHRGEAFDACRHVIDEVKRRVPVWKKEAGPGGERWIGLDP